jgi:rhamnosyltransferase
MSQSADRAVARRQVLPTNRGEPGALLAARRPAILWPNPAMSQRSLSEHAPPSRDLVGPTGVVVVCYEPVADAVVLRLASLAAAGLALMLVDNSELPAGQRAAAEAARRLDAELICSGENLGVAEAQNRGLRRAAARGCRSVVLLDQDSTLTAGDLQCLLAELQRRLVAGERIAAVGPAFVDPRSKLDFPFLREHAGRVERHVPETDRPLACDVLISSGSVVNLEAVTEIGGLDAELFIDYVDYEWCLRARQRGWQVIGVPAVRMTHELGNEVRQVYGRNVVVHAPRRQYYLVRNALLLARRPSLPACWRRHLLRCVLRQFVGYTLLCAPRLSRLDAMLRGLVDGLAGRAGRCPQDRPPVSTHDRLRPVPTLKF